MTNGECEPTLRSMLDLELNDRGLWVERAPLYDDGLPQLYGGRVLAVAAKSAALTVAPSFAAHSFHGHFVRAGQPQRPLECEVAIVRDGSAFATRSVRVTQGDRVVLVASVSFHVAEVGEEWGVAGEPLLLPPREAGPALAPPLRGFEIRPANGVFNNGWPRHGFWIRLTESLGDATSDHLAMATYVSDAGLVQRSKASGWSKVDDLRIASLDHSLWIHQQILVDQWMYFDGVPVMNSGARGLARGSFRDERGRLLATVMQECLLRPPAG